MAQGYHMIARVAGLDLKDLDAMDVRDIAKVDAHIAAIQAPKDETDPKGAYAPSRSSSGSRPASSRSAGRQRHSSTFRRPS